jgi:transposase InsO family protein
MTALGRRPRLHRPVDLSGRVNHADRGSQYLSIRYTERLADVQAAASVGSRATPTTSR